MKTFHRYDIVRRFCRTDMASQAWPTSRVGENCNENVWTTTGLCDMKNLPRSLSRHARSTNHIQNQVGKLLKAQGKTLSLNEQRILNISAHNTKVRENREILKDVINVNCSLAKQQLSYRSNDESSTSANRGNYVELLHTLAAKD